MLRLPCLHRPPTAYCGPCRLEPVRLGRAAVLSQVWSGQHEPHGSSLRTSTSGSDEGGDVLERVTPYSSGLELSVRAAFERDRGQLRLERDRQRAK